jgi:hypothetical protein
MSGCYCRSTPPHGPHHHQRRRPALTTVTPCWQRDRRPNWARNERHCQCASNDRSSSETPGTSTRPSRAYLANREGTPPAMRAVMAGRVFAHARTRGPVCTPGPGPAGGGVRPGNPRPAAIGTPIPAEFPGPGRIGKQGLPQAISRFPPNRESGIPRFPILAESGIGDSRRPDSRQNRESGERELGIWASGARNLPRATSSRC